MARRKATKVIRHEHVPTTNAKRFLDKYCHRNEDCFHLRVKQTASSHATAWGLPENPLNHFKSEISWWVDHGSNVARPAMESKANRQEKSEGANFKDAQD